MHVDYRVVVKRPNVSLTPPVNHPQRFVARYASNILSTDAV